MNIAPDRRARTLADAVPGETMVVAAVAAEGAVGRRLMTMGILRGERVDVVRTAPGGDPLWIRVRGAHLSLRRSEAAGVVVATGDGAAG